MLEVDWKRLLNATVQSMRSGSECNLTFITEHVNTLHNNAVIVYKCIKSQLYCMRHDLKNTLNEIFFVKCLKSILKRKPLDMPQPAYILIG